MLNTYAPTLTPVHTYRIHFQAPTGDYASEGVTSTERRYEDSYTDVVERFQRTYPAAKVCEVDLVA